MIRGTKRHADSCDPNNERQRATGDDQDLLASGGIVMGRVLTFAEREECCTRRQERPSHRRPDPFIAFHVPLAEADGDKHREQQSTHQLAAAYAPHH